MKKIISVVAALAMSAVSAFAVDFYLGVRGNAAVNLGSQFEGENVDNRSSDAVWGGGFALYGVVDFYNTDQFAVGVQPELGIQFNNGVKRREHGYTTTITSHTFELPVLLTMKYNITPNVYFGGGIGPYVSFQMGKVRAKTEWSNQTHTYDANGRGACFGMAFDLKGGVRAGSGYFVFDVRYLLNFNKCRAEAEYGSKTEDVFSRRALTFGIGYEVKF